MTTFRPLSTYHNMKVSKTPPTSKMVSHSKQTSQLSFIANKTSSWNHNSFKPKHTATYKLRLPTMLTSLTRVITSWKKWKLILVRFQPIWKISVTLDHFPGSCKDQPVLKPAPRTWAIDLQEKMTSMKNTNHKTSERAVMFNLASRFNF